MLFLCNSSGLYLSFCTSLNFSTADGNARHVPQVVMSKSIVLRLGCFLRVSSWMHGEDHQLDIFVKPVRAMVRLFCRVFLVWK